MTRQPALPRGPHKLTPDEVRSSQRARISEAVIDLAAERGFRHLNVGEVVAEARVSKSSFYAIFDNLADAFLAACDAFVDELFGGMIDAALATTTPMEGMVACNDYIVGNVRTRHAAAVGAFSELSSLGQRGAAIRCKMYEKCRLAFEMTTVWFRKEDPGLPPVLPGMDLAVAAGSIDLLNIATVTDTPDGYADASQAIFSLWLTATTGTTSLDPDMSAHRLDGLCQVL